MSVEHDAPMPPDPDPFRVLVVEDDRSQAVFAETILRGGGMQVETVAMPEQVLDTLEWFRPDVVLMDLHLPGMEGTELTSRIRAKAGFEDTPVVFLSGDADPDRQVEALEHGADDYIVKPVRPRYLIAAIQSRASRARALKRRQDVAFAPPTSPGLAPRRALLHIVNQRIASGEGGALLLEITHADSLRDHYGFAAFQALMKDVALRLSALPGERVTTALGDHAFVSLVPEHDHAELEAHARRLRDGLAQHGFRVGQEDLHLRATVGYGNFDHAFPDAASALAALEETARAARSSPIGLAGYTPSPLGEATGLANALAESLASGDDRLHMTFQPIVAVDGGNQPQYQILVRMRDANGQALRARDFLPVAEAAGLLPQLDRWALRQALQLLHDSRAQGRPVRLFVTQSSRTLAQETFARSLLDALDAADADGHSLVIDIRLEDALLHTLLLRQACADLAEVGVRFCLSQYRDSEEAKELLRLLPLAYVRLDVAFAEQPLPPPMREEMGRIVERAHALGMLVIGQAVEDPQAAANLWTGGVDYLQGNLVQQAARAPDYDFGSGVT